MTAVTDLRFGSHSVTSDFSQPPSHESTHTQTHTLYNQVPCWFAVYDTEPPPPQKKKNSPWSAPPHWGDRREASSWMELLCSSPEGFDPLPFISQISAFPASLEKGAGLLLDLAPLPLPVGTKAWGSLRVGEVWYILVRGCATAGTRWRSFL